MIYKAVIFDLYDTLVKIEPDEYILTKRQMAQRAGIMPDVFLDAWKLHSKQASRGIIPSVEDRVERVLLSLDVSPTENIVADMSKLEKTLQEQKVRKLAGCDTVLETLARQNFKLAIVTNTSSVAKPVPGILNIQKWFDVILFSFEHQLLKPDPAIYQKAAFLLSVFPQECIFVGDGNDLELDGAKAANMLAIKVGTSRDKRLISKQSTIYDYEVRDLLKLMPLIRKLIS